VHFQEQNQDFGSTYGKYVRTWSDWYSYGKLFDFHQVKFIDPACTDPFCPPLENPPVEDRLDVFGAVVEFKGPTEFVDGDSEGNDDICQACHRKTAYYRNDPVNFPALFNFHEDYGADSQPGGNCTVCHSHENGFQPSAGHGDDDQKVLESTNCTTAGCHDGTITGTWTPVPDIHGNNCNLCHVSASGGGPLWEPWETNNTNGGDCEDCHNGGVIADEVDERAAIHHNFKYTDKTSQGGPAGADGSAVQGLCITCHMPDIDGTGPVDRGTLTMPGNLPCNLCHIYFAGFAADPDNNTGYVTSGGKVQIYSNVFDPNTTNFGRLPTVTPLSTHAISETAAPPVSDYAACFACHGGTDFVGSAGTSPSVIPFHGLGTPYTGDTAALGGNIDDVQNAYAGPQREMVWPERLPGNPERDVPYHPAWKNLNWLACEVGYNCGNTKPYGNDSNPGWHQEDLGNRDPAGTPAPACVSGNYDIPWDNYVVGGPVPPVTINKDFGWKGTIGVSSNIPLVPLTLTSGNCALPSNTALDSRIASGTGGANNRGDFSLDNYAYVDHNAPYPAAVPNNGTVSSVDWTKIATNGTVTIFTCTPNDIDNPTSCTVTAAGDYNVQDKQTTTVSLTIKPGDMIGYWHSGGGVVDKSNQDPSPLGKGAIRRTTATVIKPAATNVLTIGADPIGDFANFGATVSAQPY
jgi:hypothetical protein